MVKLKTTSLNLIRISLMCIILANLSSVRSQISTHPVVLGRLGSSAALTCHSNNVPLRLCLWEQKESDQLIATFDQTNYRDSSSNNGYTFHGSGLEQGSCGIKIEVVKMNDLQRWKCTLLARDNTSAVFRGSVLLQGAETLNSDYSDVSVGSGGIKQDSHSGSRNFGGGIARPIITAQGSISSDVINNSQQKVAPVQEVEVQSAGLVIVPRRKDRKLVIL